MAIPPRLAPELVGEASRVMVQAKLEKACKEALAYLARVHRDANEVTAPVAALMDFAAKHGVPPLRYSSEDLKEERQTANRLKA